MPKSVKTRKSSRIFRGPSSLTTNLSKPFTPLRRFFFKLDFLGCSSNPHSSSFPPSNDTLGVPSFLGKRRRGDIGAEELPDPEAGFQHLHAYDHSVAIDNALARDRKIPRKEGLEVEIEDSTKVYAPDGSKKWTRKPAGPRSRRQVSGESSYLTGTDTSEPAQQFKSCSTPRQVHYPRGTRFSGRVALQNTDSSLGNDAVIITALETVPFMCHEELLSMSREELIDVARSLNSKLPRALAIDTSDERPMMFIRNAIEVLVGIRPEVPPAPQRDGRMKMQPIKVHEGDQHPNFFEEFSFEKRLEELEKLDADNLSPLISRFSSRRRTRDWSAVHDPLRLGLGITSRLEILAEEAEEDSDSNRAGAHTKGRKRRRLSDENESEGNRETNSDDVMTSSIITGSFDGPSSDEQPNETSTHQTSTVPNDGRALRSYSRRLKEQNQSRHLSEESTALAAAVLERGYKAKVRRKPLRPRSKRTRRASERARAEEKDQHNSIVFPTIKSLHSSADYSHSSGSGCDMRREQSSQSNGSGSTYAPSSSRSGKSGEGSMDHSPVLSTQSMFSSESKASATSSCTKSTRAAVRTSNGDRHITSREG